MPPSAFQARGQNETVRADVATVVADKVERGRFTEGDALKIARLMFNENPKRWYELG